MSTVQQIDLERYPSPQDNRGFFSHVFNNESVNIDVESDKDVYTTNDEMTVDTLLEAGGFISPNEFYSKNTGVYADNAKDEGYFSTEGSVSESIIWFWVEDLRNWCSYSVESASEHESVVRFILRVWNGKNGWIPFTSEWRNNKNYLEFVLKSTEDPFGISKYQYELLDELTTKQKNCLAKMSGSAQSIKQGTAFPSHLYQGDEHAWHNYFDFCASMQIIYGLRLQKNIKYTINDATTFQTIRWSSLPYNGTCDDFARYASTNARFAVTTGAPPVWRLPTGEVFLATFLEWRGDNGGAYCYIKDNSLGGFRKHTDPDLFPHEHVAEWRVMGTNNLTAAQWLNTICKKFFGDGLEKTIEKDWLRKDSELITKDKIDYVNSNYMNMLDSSKTFEQNNINKQNTLKCGFKVNRPVVTTEDSKTGDYVGKW